MPGLTGPVTVSFSAQGLASIDGRRTRTTCSWRWGTCTRSSGCRRSTRSGVSARAASRSSAGPSDLASDEFELRLGLLRTAQNEWARTTGTARAALLAYAQGVNDDIAAGPRVR